MTRTGTHLVELPGLDFIHPLHDTLVLLSPFLLSLLSHRDPIVVDTLDGLVLLLCDDRTVDRGVLR